MALEMINGYVVIADKPGNTACDYRTILAVCERPSPSGPVREYVIAWADHRTISGPTEWASGNYVFGDFARAVEIFTNR